MFICTVYMNFSCLCVILCYLQSSKVIGWLKDIIDGSHFLFSHNICHRFASYTVITVNKCYYIHRDMKLDNLLISGNTIKISDFGLAIRLDSTMKLPFVFCKYH